MARLLFLLGLFVLAECERVITTSSYSGSTSSASSSSSASSATSSHSSAGGGSSTSTSSASASSSTASAASSSTSTSTVEDECPCDEEYNNCTDSQCVPRTCDDLGYPLNCTEDCTAGCVCQSGSVRDSNGRCIRETDCPSCRADFNAMAGCSNCYRNCITYNKSGVNCSQPCYFNSCTCKDGYVYDRNQQHCVDPSQCTAQCTDDNEAINDCTNDQCIARTCDQLGSPLNCTEPCNPGCVCASGYLYDKTLKKCIPSEQCSDDNNQCPENEEYNNCTTDSCEARTCAELGFPLECLQPNYTCEPGCVCTSGYLRDSNGTCVKDTECPGCGDDPYAGPGCSNYCGHTCADYLSTESEGRACAQYCELNGCACKEGYVYKENIQRCVLPGQCSEQCPENEEYNNCTTDSCEARTCAELGFPLECLQPNSTYTCEPGCVCTSGYLRDSNGTCVKDTDCLICDGINEEYSECPEGRCVAKTCDEVGSPIACPDLPPDCPNGPGCVCSEGFIRADNGTCILEKDCPSLCPDEHEEYNNCPFAQCVPKYCLDVGFPIACPSLPVGGECEGGCICKAGYLRNSYGDCIESSECPSCGGNPNATIGCGTPSRCGHSCSDYLETDKVCPLGCSFNSCKCRDEYVWDPNVDKCVSPSDCTPVCAANQTYALCNVNCEDAYCPENDGPMAQCLPPDLPPGCRCSPNFRIGDDGNCILASECTPVQCTRDYEEWYACPDFLSQDCEDRNDLENNSPYYCQPGCYCKRGYYKNSEGLCVTEDECDD